MRLLLMLLALLVPAVQAAPLWELQGTTSRIRLLGSIHFLRAADYPLPDAVERAFTDADVLLMELDLDDLDPAAAQAVMQDLSVDPAGRDLQDLIGPAEFRRVREAADAMGVDPAALLPYEPWYAALQITQLRLMQLGFDPSWGIESQFVRRAAESGKEILGLETMEMQLAALDGLPPKAQRVFLARTLDEAADLDARLDQVLAAWRAGDADALEAELLGDLKSQPDVYRSLLVDRNRHFASRIGDLADDGGDYLVVIGALHLVGNDSVLRMLEAAGYRNRQLHD